MRRKIISILLFLLFFILNSLFLIPSPILALSTTTLYFGPVEKTYDDSGRVVEEKVYYPAGSAVAVKTVNSEQETVNTNYLHSDHLGSTVLVTDENGDKKEDYVYYPFGNQITDNIQHLTDRLYTGQRIDSSTDLYFYNARYYNPAIGHFISADKAEGPNRYAYVGNNPVMRNDPSGKVCILGLFQVGGSGSQCGLMDDYMAIPISYSGSKSVELPDISAFTGKDDIKKYLLKDPNNPSQGYVDISFTLSKEMVYQPIMQNMPDLGLLNSYKGTIANMVANQLNGQKITVNAGSFIGALSNLDEITKTAANNAPQKLNIDYDIKTLLMLHADIKHQGLLASKLTGNLSAEAMMGDITADPEGKIIFDPSGISSQITVKDANNKIISSNQLKSLSDTLIKLNYDFSFDNPLRQNRLMSVTRRKLFYSLFEDAKENRIKETNDISP